MWWAFRHTRRDATEIGSLEVEDSFDPDDRAGGVPHILRGIILKRRIHGMLAEDFSKQGGDVVAILQMDPNLT